MISRLLLSAILCLSFVLPHDAFAREVLRLKPGVKVQLKGKTHGVMTLARPRGNNVSGTFECSCGGAGTCTLMQQGGAIICLKGSSDTCNSTCNMTTTIPSAIRGLLVHQ